MSLSSNWSAQCSGLQFVLTRYLVAFPQMGCEGSQCRHLVNVYCSSVGQHWQVAIKRGCCCLQKGENIRTSVAMRPRCQPCTAEAEAPRGTFKKRTEPTLPPFSAGACSRCMPKIPCRRKAPDCARRTNLPLAELGGLEGPGLGIL